MHATGHMHSEGRVVTAKFRETVEPEIFVGLPNLSETIDDLPNLPEAIGDLLNLSQISLT